MKRIFMFIISIIIMFTFNVSALEYNISNEEELINALSNQSTNDTINLNDNIAINNNISITGNVLINGNGYTISYGNAYSAKLFKVTGSLELLNMKLNGNNNWNWKNEEDRFKTDVYGNETTLNIGDKIINSNVFEVTGNLKLTNSTVHDYFFTGSDGDTNSFIKATGENSKVIIDNSVVDNLYGTFIYMTNGKVELNNNSKIINSYGLGNKGSLLKMNGGELLINNATLKDNCGMARSGSLIGAVNNSLITFNNGLIDNNVAKYHGSNSTGSMITLETGAGFVMNGGVISNNVGTLSSVIATRWTNNPDDRGVILNGGIIKNNTATKNSWLYASVFVRSSLIIGKDMIITGDVVVNNTNATMENNGIIEGKVTLNDTTAKAVNNGIIKNVDVLKGEFINNNLIENAYELNTQIDNKGTITKDYIKELSDVEGKVIVEFDLDDGKEKETGYTVLDKIYDLNYKFTLDDILEVEKEGYNFIGWFTDSEYKNKLEDEIELKENIVIYAKWEKIPEVKVPDTYLSVNKILIILGSIFVILGSILIYLIINNKTLEQ